MKYDNEDEKISILEQYHMRAIKLCIMFGLIGIIIWYSVFNITNIINENSRLSNKLLLIIDIFIVIPEIILLSMHYKRLVYNGKLNKKIFNQIATVSLIVSLVNYFILTFFTPSNEVWYVAYFLIILQMLFLSIKRVVAINIIMLFSIIIMYIIQAPKDISKYLFFQELSIRLGGTVLIMILVIINVYCSGKVLLNLKEERERYLLKYFNNIEENQNQIREIKHNLRNQVIVLKSLIDNKDFDGVERFVNNMIGEAENLKIVTYTENIVVDSILNYKINESIKLNIKWNIEVQVSRDLNIETEDFGTILGNLLDNAIEACTFIEESKRKVDVKIYNKNNSIMIYINNTKKCGINVENTWKEDKLNHGIGLKSVQKLVEKYNGAMSSEDKDDMYETNLILWT